MAGSITAIEGATAEVRAALRTRAAAIAAGFDAAVRPADVAALGATRHPLHIPGLDGNEARHLRSLVREALDGLTPQVMHTTDTRSAVRMLARAGRIPNAYDMLETSVAERPKLYGGVEDAVLGRAQLELSHGMFGTGTNVYGTVHFSDLQHAPMKSHTGNLLLREPGWSVGSRQFGDVGVVLRPGVVDRSSFLPADTGISGASELRAREELPDVVSRRIARNFLMDRDPAGGMMTTDTPWGDFRTIREIQGDLRSILTMPREQAVAAIREHLTSTAMSTHYMEAQVRWATMDDIAALHVRRFRVPSSGVPAGREQAVRDYEALQQQLVDTARARGITVHVDDEPVPVTRRAAERANWWA